MLRGLYARWMYKWETALTMRDSNRVVRPVEWGFEWLADFIAERGLHTEIFGRDGAQPPPGELADPHTNPTAYEFGDRAMRALNAEIIRHSDDFFGYRTPADFRLETRHPQLFPTNVRPETLAKDQRLRQRAEQGKLAPAEFLRFTSPVRSPYPENDLVNARWYPAPPKKSDGKHAGKPKQAMIVMPQWNADAFSHNALCSMFNRFGISALRLSKPYHDIRRPAELERSDYAVSSNIGRTMAACRQAVVDIRSCLDWLEQQGYEQFGVLATSLGSCYAFMAAAHDPRLRVGVFNHAAPCFGDVVWTGQSTRHIRAAFEAVMTQDHLRELWSSISPLYYMQRFASTPKKVLMIHAKYDLTFLPQFSEEVLRNFAEYGIDYVSKVLPCGHYTTGETPYKFIDGWWMGSFVYSAFKALAKEPPSQDSSVSDVRREEAFLSAQSH
jgi:dienelactone hydrolase